MIHKAHAKINLGLRILNKKDNGFHNIETIYYPLTFGDELHIKIKSARTNMNSLKIISDNLFVPKDKTNICFKAIANFYKEYNIKSFFNIEIFIKKNIPIGSGLGGGSSDAAEVIKHLVKFFKINIQIDRKRIMNIATSTGSDVPFFLVSKPCYATGIGEKLRMLNNFKIEQKILVVIPKEHISTKAAYEDLNISADYNRPLMLEKIERFSLSDKALYVNDFEKVIFPKYPEIKSIKDDLESMGSAFSSLSGSGSGVFGLYDDVEAAKAASKYFTDKGYFVQIS